MKYQYIRLKEWGVPHVSPGTETPTECHSRNIGTIFRLLCSLSHIAEYWDNIPTRMVPEYIFYYYDIEINKIYAIYLVCRVLKRILEAMYCQVDFDLPG